MIDLTFGCCFCGQPIERPQVPKPVIFEWGEDEEEWQQWWSHLNCFIECVHLSARHFAWEDEEMTI